MASLIAITGIDPFANDLDADEPSILRFVRAWREVKASPLKVTDLDYLLRHQDSTGKLEPSDDELLRAVKVLRDAMTAVDADLGAAAAEPGPERDQGEDGARLRRRGGGAAVHADRPHDDVQGAVRHDRGDAAGTADRRRARDRLRRVRARSSRTPASCPRRRRRRSTPRRTRWSSATWRRARRPRSATRSSRRSRRRVQTLRDEGAADLAALAADYPELAAVFTAADAVTDPAAKSAAVLDAILPELRDGLKALGLRTSLTAITKADAPDRRRDHERHRRPARRRRPGARRARRLPRPREPDRAGGERHVRPPDRPARDRRLHPLRRGSARTRTSRWPSTERT